MENMNSNYNNHPFVVLSSCLLWVISIFSIVWSLLLFFCVSDMLFLTGTDLVNAVLLLSGIIMLPTNLFIIYSVATGQKIEYTAKVGFCRLWMGIVWTIIVNLIGVVLCLQRIYSCEAITFNYLTYSIKQYRTIPKQKHFIDNLQWSLGCCGVMSYRDWFTCNWHDKTRDFDWSPISERTAVSNNHEETDSVPFSCCRSGSCVASYLKEVGTFGIYTDGCGYVLYKIILVSMNAHLILFVLVIILEGFLLRSLILNKERSYTPKRDRNFQVSNIMSVNDNFEVSSASYQLNAEDSDELDLDTKH